MRRAWGSEPQSKVTVGSMKECQALHPNSESEMVGRVVRWPYPRLSPASPGCWRAAIVTAADVADVAEMMWLCAHFHVTMRSASVAAY